MPAIPYERRLGLDYDCLIEDGECSPELGNAVPIVEGKKGGSVRRGRVENVEKVEFIVIGLSSVLLSMSNCKCRRRNYKGLAEARRVLSI